MSIDFDSAALQTQHEEEEYDQEDYAREQELHKLLTDLPDDMLEDSRDSSPELDHSACSNQDPGNSQQPAWPQQTAKWSDHQRPGSHEENYEDNYDQGSYHDEYAYEDGAARINGFAGQPQSQPPPHTWNPQGQDYQYNHGDFTYCSVGTEKSAVGNDFSTEEGYEHEPHAHRAPPPAVGFRRGGGQSDEQSRDENNARNHFQNFESGAPGDRRADPYKASYKPYQAASQPTMFQPETAHQDGHYDQLQRDFLDSAQDTADNQQLAQVQILNKAQLRQIEDLESKLEDSRRNLRYLEHQFAIVKDEKEGLAVSLKESGQLIEEAKEREGRLTGDVKSLELQVQTLAERDRENVKKQRVAEAAVASLQQQMTELCRSDTLSRAREQHDRDLSVVREQHEAKLLVLQQKLDSCSQALEEQAEVGQRLREQAKQLERQREEEQVDRAGVVNALTQRLEESQQQCAKLLQTGSVQEMSQMQIKLQQAQSAKTLSENMNQALQDDLRDLKEQISLYESAVKHGALALDLNGDWEDQLSESCVDLGIKKANWKNGILHSASLAHATDPKLPREEALRELRAELQRCLASLRGKRQRIGQLQEQLRDSQGRADELQAQLDRAQLTNTATAAATSRGDSPEKLTDLSSASQKELLRLQEDRQRLQEHVVMLEKKNKELKQSEEKVRSANTELCTKMREMIQELDQEKQEAAERYERTQQQFRDDVVNRVRAELTLEHAAQVQRLTAEHQQQIQQLQSKLSEVSGEVLAVQECYISVCKEKDKLEVNLQSTMEEGEAKMREIELTVREESSASLERLRTELESQHQAAAEQLKALWSTEQTSKVQQQVQSQLASARAAWQEEQEQTERVWAERLEEEEARRRPHAETREAASQTQGGPDGPSREELEAALDAERLRLRREADAAQRRAAEEVRKHVQRELQEEHLEDMARQVEGAVTRAYSRWLQDLASLPEYKANLQREREKWEELHEKRVQEQVSLALGAAAEERRGGASPEEQRRRRRRAEELEEELASSRGQLERVRGEQAALLRAELAAARAAWDGDWRREASSLRARHERERGELERSLQRAREESERKEEELRQARDDSERKEAELQRATRERREEVAAQQQSRGRAARQQGREEALRELRAGLAEVRRLLPGDGPAPPQAGGGEGGDGGPAQEGTVRRILQTACQDMLSAAVAQAKEEWKRVSEERLAHALRDAQECHEREITHIHSAASQRGEQGHCGKQCAETVAKLQKKNQDLQRHLEKACRQLQHTVRENKASTQRLKDEQETILRKEKEDHLLRLEEVKRSAAQAPHGGSDNPQNPQAGLEEMKEQYMRAVGKIRGDMLRYLQESKERASEMIRAEVQRERQDTARKMRRYYLTCLQELLDEGGQATGAEKKILSAASKLAAMARVLETPAKRKPAKTHSLRSSSSNTEAATENSPAGSSVSTRHRSPETSAPETRSEKRTSGGKADSKHNPTAVVKTRTKPPSRALHQDPLVPPAHHPSLKAPPQTEKAFPTDFTSANVTLRTQSREAYLQGENSGRADQPVASELQRRPFLIRETPVRDQGQSDWSSVSNSSLGDAFVAAHARQGGETASARSCPLSSGDLGDFRVFTADDSDVTVYKEVAGVPSLAFPGVQMSARREPVPGSEGDRQPRVCSKSLFSELKLQQDSGFDSPFSLRK